MTTQNISSRTNHKWICKAHFEYLDWETLQIIKRAWSKYRMVAWVSYLHWDSSQLDFYSRIKVSGVNYFNDFNYALTDFLRFLWSWLHLNVALDKCVEVLEQSIDKWIELLNLSIHRHLIVEELIACYCFDQYGHLASCHQIRVSFPHFVKDLPCRFDHLQLLSARYNSLSMVLQQRA